MKATIEKKHNQLVVNYDHDGFYHFYDMGLDEFIKIMENMSIEYEVIKQ